MLVGACWLKKLIQRHAASGLVVPELITAPDTNIGEV
jgi:hypothetical protein